MFEKLRRSLFKRKDSFDSEDEIIIKYDPRQCGNCHAFMKNGDRYCRKCGTKRGEGAFAPYQNIMMCIYGPMPVEQKHKCISCGYNWTTVEMIDEDEFCPLCGKPAPVIVPRR